MTKYMILFDDGDMDFPREDLPDVAKAAREVALEARDAGVWVFSAGLHPASSATVLRPRDGQVLMTDGPYTEGHEHIGGFTVLDAEDLDAALAWGRRMAEVITLPIEVRPVTGE